MRASREGHTLAVWLLGILFVAVLARFVIQAGDRQVEELPTPPTHTTGRPSQSEPYGPTWVVDPSDPGENLPPVGRSLFDFLVTEPKGNSRTYKIPFPFTDLLTTIERRLEAETRLSPLKRVLIPLGRSLQRNAAKPEFFKYPRAVVAVDTEPPMESGHSGMLLKDRLYLGYQEKATVLEVISYNEAAGRFEFQIVQDYRAGGEPRVVYANRAVCTVCHQNQAPIFARPLWDETNANPQIASLLLGQGRNFYDFPIDQGVDVPNAVDQATDRANDLAAYQLLWQEGCESARRKVSSIACRANLFTLMLQYRLTGSRHFDTRSSPYTDQLVPVLAEGWRERWPAGLYLPNPDIPNRNPALSLGPRGEDQTLLHHVALRSGMRSLFDPSVPRDPKEAWPVSDQATRLMDRAVTGLSSFIAEPDIRRLDAHLFRKGKQAARSGRPYQSLCQYGLRRREASLERLTFRCQPPARLARGADGGFSMEGVVYLNAGRVARGTINRVSMSEGDDVRDLAVTGGTVKRKGDRRLAQFQIVQKYSTLHARRADGNAIKDFTVWWKPLASASSPGSPATVLSGDATMTVMEDFAAVHRAVDEMARLTHSGVLDVFESKPFRRVSVMKALYEHLGMAPIEWCCIDDRGMPRATVVQGATGTAATLWNAPQTNDPALTSFHRYCAMCHQGEETSPPNFLYGAPQRVRDQLNRCAERIFFRLEMWRFDRDERPETPMPPTNALRRLHVTPEHWPTHGDLASLQHYVAEVLRSQTGTVPRLEEYTRRGYDDLRDCLPGPASPGQAGARDS